MYTSHHSTIHLCIKTTRNTAHKTHAKSLKCICMYTIAHSNQFVYLLLQFLKHVESASEFEIFSRDSPTFLGRFTPHSAMGCDGPVLWVCARPQKRRSHLHSNERPLANALSRIWLYGEDVPHQECLSVAYACSI